MRWLAIIILAIAVSAITKSWLISTIIVAVVIYNRVAIEWWIYDKLDKKRNKN